MKRVLSKLCCVIFALSFIISITAIISGAASRNNDNSISFTPVESKEKDFVEMYDEISNVFVSSDEEHQDLLQCNYEDHVLDAPQYVINNKYPFYYMRIDICSICGYEARSHWAIYIPDGATEIPAPGSERDTLLGLDKGFSCE